MSNRTTVKSNIAGLNVPTVTNAIMGQMLVDNICDNVVFREDVIATQTSSVSSITVDFTDKDRIELTRTGGSLNITINNVNNGEEKMLFITKTTGQIVTFANAYDASEVKENLYQWVNIPYIVKKINSQIYVKALVDSVGLAAINDANGGAVAPVTDINASQTNTLGFVNVPTVDTVNTFGSYLRSEWEADITDNNVTQESTMDSKDAAVKTDVSTAYPLAIIKSGTVTLGTSDGEVDYESTVNTTVDLTNAIILFSFEMSADPGRPGSFSYVTAWNLTGTSFSFTATVNTINSVTRLLNWVVVKQQTLV